ncbi:MAG: hypothetical protein J6C29_00300 [Clostridia bacterium]|nr:hypothetical protein [Clostridia bacterium]
MWLVLSVCFVTFTAILGITEILRRFWLFIMRPKDTPPLVLIVNLKEEIAVQQLRYALEFLSWERKGDFSSAVLNTASLSEKTYKEIEKIANSRNDIILCEDLK